MHLCTLLVFVFLVLQEKVNSARILGVFPVASLSHQVVFRELTLELAKRGHSLVVVTPNPINKTIENFVEIPIENKQVNFQERLGNNARGKRGVIHSPDVAIENTIVSIMLYSEQFFEDENFQKLLKDESQKFDLIILESFNRFALPLKNIYSAPVILISSLDILPTLYGIFGAPTAHPILYPSVLNDRFHELTMYERVTQVYKGIQSWYYENHKEKQIQTRMLNKYFGESYNIDELLDNIDLVFVNMNNIFEGNRPIPPNIINIGGIHLQPVKDLPQDLKNYLDNSKRGVIFVSLGTNVSPSQMDPDLMDAFLMAFKELPYDILWKTDYNNTDKIPENVIARKWFPQRDMLHHQNIKVFITQGGIQSTDETIDAGVPIVGIPFLGDQWFNIEKQVKFGVGVKLDASTLTSKDIVEGVNKIMSNYTSYKQNVKKLRTLIQDQPQTPLERAVWWTEYVIRHRGAKHLRANTFNMSWTEYLMLDVVAVVSLTLVILSYVLVMAMTYVKTLLLQSSKLKND